MKKSLAKTKNGDLDKQIKVILKILWVTRDDPFYFNAYGHDIIKRLVKDWLKKGGL